MDLRFIEIGTSDGKFSVKVPDDFFSYKPNESLVLRRNGEGVEYIEFATYAADCHVYIEHGTGNVMSGWDINDLGFANSSISLFSKCMTAVASRYPYYAEDAEAEEWIAARDRLDAVIRSIDPPAADEDTYWSEFTSDVLMGDYS
ncbi:MULTISPECIES: SUKH-4 family immunity protein [unclassified Streptomyces]|uniref:SUKH-4 family immunity protein n=1 Tax=unclassified Streptomyces TaxID=2593676 RepID=UPI002E21E472|nr:SUKH-4 family immunity protein [Streptomyces sp. NBC_01014]WSX71416.1 SUKH-4 family immunity protein [Streptomyces sp. NBC_00932]